MIGPLLAEAAQAGQSALAEHASRLVIAAAGVPVVTGELATSREAAVAAADRLGYPVVLKGHGADLLHKTELDLVRVNLADAEAVAACYDDFAARRPGLSEVLVQTMVRGRRELVIGLTRDPQFGPCVMFGLGGVLTEALKDVVFRVAPLTEDDAHEMMDELRTKKLLGPWRGEPPVDRAALARALVGVGQLGLAHPAIAEIDVNPLIVSPDGTPVAVDALVVLARS